MRKDLKEFGEKPREDQKGILICCFRGLGKTWMGYEFAKDVGLNYPKLFNELMAEINLEWSQALESRKT